MKLNNVNHNAKRKYSELLDSLKGKDKISVLFVCLGNICRSPAAEGVFREILKEEGDESRWYVDSAGTAGYHAGDLPDRRMRVHAWQRGIELNHICRRVTDSDLKEFDLILAMDANNEKDLRQKASTIEESRKIMPMAAFIDPSMGYDYVPDPYYEGAEGFELVLDLLMDGCRNLKNLNPIGLK